MSYESKTDTDARLFTCTVCISFRLSSKRARVYRCASFSMLKIPATTDTAKKYFPSYASLFSYENLLWNVAGHAYRLWLHKLALNAPSPCRNNFISPGRSAAGSARAVYPTVSCANSRRSVIYFVPAKGDKEGGKKNRYPTRINVCAANDRGARVVKVQRGKPLNENPSGRGFERATVKPRSTS